MTALDQARRWAAMAPDPRAWLLASLASWRGFWAAWAIIVGAPVVIVAMLVLAAGAPEPADTTAQAGASLDLAAAQGVTPPPAAREQMARLSFARSPPPPEFPPAQTAPAPRSGRLFGLRADQRDAFDAAARHLVGLHDACGARLDPAAPGAEPTGLAETRAELEAAIRPGDKVRGLISYHRGLVDLCAGQIDAAHREFDRALEAIDGAGAALKAATSRETGRLAQYRLVAHYARGLTEMAPGQAHRDLDAADKDFDAAQKAGADPALAGRAGAFVELSETHGDLFEFSGAEIVQARIAERLADGDLAGAATAAAPAFQSTATAIQHPPLAVSLALAASAGGHAEVVARLVDALRADMGTDPADSDWVQKRKDVLTQFLAAAATAPVKIFVAGDEAWWPGGADAAAATEARRVFDAKAREGLTRDALWFPPLNTSQPQDAETIDRFLWIRREMTAAAAYRFDQLDMLRRAEAALPAADRIVLSRVRRGLLRQVGAVLMAQVEQARSQDNGAGAAAPLLARLSSTDFPIRVWVPARLARVTGLRPRTIGLILWIAVAAGLVLFLIHRELAIGYHRTFPHRHHDQRRRAGPAWADIPPSAPGDDGAAPGAVDAA